MTFKVDPTIMQELLDSNGVRQNVARMSAETLGYYKDLLVSDGIYQRFVLEKQQQQLKDIVGSGKAKRH